MLSSAELLAHNSAMNLKAQWSRIALAVLIGAPLTAA
jgi:hypothetical protein